MSRLRVAVAVAALLTLSACGSEAESGADPTADKPTKTAEAEPTTDAPKVATCKLGKGDVKLEQVDDALYVTFNGHPVPETGTVLYSSTVYDDAGEHGAQLGMKYQDGDLTGYFAFDYDTSQQTNLDGEPDHGPAQITGKFPLDELGEVGEIGVASWSATLSVDGNDVARCPADTMESNAFPG